MSKSYEILEFICENCDNKFKKKVYMSSNTVCPKCGGYSLAVDYNKHANRPTYSEPLASDPSWGSRMDK